MKYSVNNRPYLISWKITDSCNFRCKYCFDSGKKKTLRKIDFPRAIHSILSTRKKWIIRFTGGEPFSYPGFVDLCEQLSEHYLIGVNTNLSMEKELNDFVSRIPSEKVDYFLVSLHIGERKRLKNKEVFLRNLLLLKQKGYGFKVISVFYPDTSLEFEEYRKIFEKNKIKFELKPFKGTYSGKEYPASYTSEEINLIKKFNPTYMKQFPVFSNGVKCSAGKNLIRIWPDGTVTRCNSDLTKIGDVEKSINLYADDQKCSAKRCSCYNAYIKKSLLTALKIRLNYFFNDRDKIDSNLCD